MPLYSHLPRKVALFVEAAIPALLIFSILGIGYVKTTANTQLSHQNRDKNEQIAAVQLKDALNACDAIHASDMAFHDFLVKSIGSGPRANDPTVKKFFVDLATAQQHTYDACRAKARAGAVPPP